MSNGNPRIVFEETILDDWPGGSKTYTFERPDRRDGRQRLSFYGWLNPGNIDVGFWITQEAIRLISGNMPPAECGARVLAALLDWANSRHGHELEAGTRYDFEVHVSPDGTDVSVAPYAPDVG